MTTTRSVPNRDGARPGMTSERGAAPGQPGAANQAGRHGKPAGSDASTAAVPDLAGAVKEFEVLVRACAEDVGPDGWTNQIPELEASGKGLGLPEDAIELAISRNRPGKGRPRRSPPRPSPSNTECDVVCMADVTSEPVPWLWRLWIPRGKITMVDGDPKTGKSTLLLDIAARVTTGKAMPDGSGGSNPADVLLLTAEDGLSDTVGPRLEAAGADLSRVHVLRSVPELDADGRKIGKRLPQLPRDLPYIEAIVSKYSVVLIIIDVLSAFLGGRDHNQDVEVRRALSPVAAMAEAMGPAVVAIRHLNKSGGENAMYRGVGSIGLAGQARSLLLVGVDGDDPSGDRRVLASIGCNVAKSPTSQAYRLIEDPGRSCARVDWLGPTDHTPCQLVAGPADEDERVERDSVIEVINELLTAKAMTYPQLQDGLRAAGLAPHKKTIQRACKRIGVVRRPRERGGAWWLHLPGGPFPDGEPASCDDATSPSAPVHTGDGDPYPSDVSSLVQTAPDQGVCNLRSSSLDKTGHAGGEGGSLSHSSDAPDDRIAARGGIGAAAFHGQWRAEGVDGDPAIATIGRRLPR